MNENNKSLDNKDIDINEITNNIEKENNINQITNLDDNNINNELQKNIDKNNEKINININNNLNTENNLYQDNYINKVEMLEFLIDIIKKYSYNNIKDEISEKNKQKKEIENNINILNSKLNSIKIQKKNFNTLSKCIKNEMFRIDKNIRKISKDLYCEEELNKMKNDINILLNKIKKEKDELANTNINISENKREIHLLKDEIKKYNNLIRQLKSENEIYSNSIRLLDRHISLVKEKLDKQNDKSNDFFIALTNLAIKSKKCEMERRLIQNNKNNNIKRAKSCKGPKGKKNVYNFNFL